MAGVTVVTSSGTATMAADNVGSASAPTTGERTPYYKLDHGAAGSSSPATVLNPSPVGQVIQLIQITPTLDTSAYASGDLIADVTTITGAALGSGGLCELVSVTVVDQDDQAASAYTLYITNLATSWGSLNAAPAPSDATGLGIQAIIPIDTADWKDLVAFKVAQPRIAQNIGVICKTSGSANLYLTIVNGAGTPTFTASGWKITLGFRQVAVS
jgi:hypothetical protein